MNINNIKKCLIHNMTLKYHCTTCHQDICSDCGLIQQKHKSHIIKPIQIKKCTIISTELKQLKLKMSQKIYFARQQYKKFLLQSQLLKSQIKYNKTKIYQYYEELILKLQKESQLLLKQIQQKLQQCSRDIDQKLRIKQKMDKIDQIQSSSSIRVRSESKDQIHNYQILDKELMKYLQDNEYLNIRKQRPINRSNKQMQEQQEISAFSNLSFLDKKIYELSIMKEIYPQYQNFSFEIDYIVDRDTQIIYSPNYKVFGYEWRLKIYPKGNMQVQGEYVSVFLELINSPDALTVNPTKEYYFRLQLLNLNTAGKSIIKQYNSKFSVGQCWGYAQFIPIQQIVDYLHDGKLLFVMGIKNISYYDQCQNMKRYITKLEGQNKILQQLCQGYYINPGIQNDHDSSSSDPIDHHLLSVHHDEISSIISSVEDFS